MDGGVSPQCAHQLFRVDVFFPEHFRSYAKCFEPGGSAAVDRTLEQGAPDFLNAAPVGKGSLEVKAEFVLAVQCA
ncbi:hypothetical protein BG36_14890 [Aquamicrobium defluvii]|uniref:Uncharacterized protein n=1 Tax=Aquamicrobium defluvii TaxID=69279 RepID=A0A011STF0_9HYPH|nr:hypothetical protein BG36_14890 [Aquamicrobium defluvii]EZQ13147.1 hypothetical protein CF98_29800 [Halopseudomonas bauzanensis]